MLTASSNPLHCVFLATPMFFDTTSSGSLHNSTKAHPCTALHCTAQAIRRINDTYTLDLLTLRCHFFSVCSMWTVFALAGSCVLRLFPIGETSLCAYRQHHRQLWRPFLSCCVAEKHSDLLPALPPRGRLQYHT